MHDFTFQNFFYFYVICSSSVSIDINHSIFLVYVCYVAIIENLKKAKNNYFLIMLPESFLNKIHVFSAEISNSLVQIVFGHLLVHV